MFIEARRWGVFDRSDVKIITWCVMCVCIIMSRSTEHRHTSPLLLCKQTWPIHKGGKWWKYVTWKRIKILVKVDQSCPHPHSWTEVEVDHETGQVSRILLQIGGRSWEGCERRHQTQGELFFIKMLIFLAQTLQHLVTTSLYPGTNPEGSL